LVPFETKSFMGRQRTVEAVLADNLRGRGLSGERAACAIQLMMASRANVRECKNTLLRQDIFQ
jgi:hypothetical protein